MIQDIFPHRFSNEYKRVKPTNDSYALYFEGRSVFISEKEELIFPQFNELKGNTGSLYSEATYLFSIDDDHFFLLDNIGDKPVSYAMADISIFRTARPLHLAFAGVTAYGLHNWYINHRFCGRCGNRLAQDEKERMLRCDNCGNTEYPKISPAVIVGVTNGDKILLSKYAGREYTKYALLAGFTEIGETIEETVRREVFEEVGLHVKDIRYYKSQPWGFSDTLLLGFFAELEGDDTIQLDAEELSLAEWFTRDDLPSTDSDISLTNEMIECFRKNQTQAL